MTSLVEGHLEGDGHRGFREGGCSFSWGGMVLGVGSLSCLFNHRSFQKPVPVLPRIPEVF